MSAIELHRRETVKMRTKIHQLREEIRTKDIKITSLESRVDLREEKLNDV